MDRVDITRTEGTRRLRCWRHGNAQSSHTTSIVYGQLADGRWFAERTGKAADADDRQQGACVFGSDDKGATLALRLAYGWMREGEWRAQPAEFDANGKPTDGLPWVRRGSEWMLENDEAPNP